MFWVMVFAFLLGAFFVALARREFQKAEKTKKFWVLFVIGVALISFAVWLGYPR